MDFDEKLVQIDERLREVEAELSRLSALKRKLTAAKEQLQDRKYLEQNNQLAKNDWSQGWFVIGVVSFFKQIFRFRTVSMVADYPGEVENHLQFGQVQKPTT